jgi:hypothetical protein
MPDDTNDFAFWREQPDWARDLHSSLDTSMAYQFTNEYQHDFYDLFGDCRCSKCRGVGHE